ncbi:AfsR/SARP family transcriptional regulator [Solihabitans fulvus]|uniref:AfsR/SARP family transcriptional regulator n=1 Tax=Solihabitans fulvus TaxID=1892852 RepID=UPI001661C5AE|nr:BTAD domain-containing putative transcriptional regulator [Solihabitans fulvus]
MEFRVLGPLEAHGSSGQARLPGQRQPALLAVLLLHANRVVTVDQLSEVLWGEAPPPNSEAAVQTYVFRLRAALAAVEPDGGQRLSFSSGYRLQVEPGELDLDAFREHVQRGRDVAADGHDDTAAAAFSTALGLWRGDALAGLPGTYFQAQAVRLAEERLAALEDRVDADLALGRHAEVVVELQELTARHPVRERPRGQLMLALHRSGRRAEALTVFTELRDHLANELGIDPSAALARLHQRILANDATLDTPRPAPSAPRNDLPGDIADFTGRTTEMDRLLAEIPADGGQAAVVIEAIDGMAGVGKTTLAVHAAHHLTDRYPDAQLFIDLHGHTTEHDATTPLTALDSLLRALGVSGQQIPTDLDQRAARWRAELADRRAVVVLDNAVSANQVRPLLPGSPGCLVLVTSRRRLGDLETAQTLSLDVLPEQDAVDLFGRVAGAARVAAEPEAVAEVVRLCGYLPLAIRIASARLRSRPAWTTDHLATRLRAEHRILTELATDDRSVAAAFDLSLRELPADRQRLFLLLGGVHPGPDLDAHATAALAGTTPTAADHALDALHADHLIQETTPGRYQLHDLLRAHARNHAVDLDPDDCGRATARVLEYYLHTAHTATGHLPTRHLPLVSVAPIAPDHPYPISDAQHARTWLNTEVTTLTSMVNLAAQHALHTTHAVHLAAALHGFLRAQGHWDRALGIHQTALDTAQHTGDRLGQASALTNLGDVHCLRGNNDAAMDSLTRAYALYTDLGNPLGQASALTNLGDVQRLRGDSGGAMDSLTRAYALYTDLGSQFGQANTVLQLGDVQRVRGDFGGAMDSLTRAYALYTDLGNPLGQANTVLLLGVAHRERGDFGAAMDSLTRADALYTDLGNQFGQVNTLANLGVVQRLRGDFGGAMESLARAYALYTDLGNPLGQAHALARLGLVQHAQGDFGAAMDSLTRADTLYTDLGDPQGQATTMLGLGITRHQTQHYDAAIESLNQALALFTDVGDTDGEAETYNALGDLALAHSGAGDPRTYFDLALTRAHSSGWALHEANALAGQARCLLAADPSGATTLLRQALAIHQRLGVPEAARTAALLASIDS